MGRQFQSYYHWQEVSIQLLDGIRLLHWAHETGMKWVSILAPQIQSVSPKMTLTIVNEPLASGFASFNLESGESLADL